MTTPQILRVGLAAACATMLAAAAPPVDRATAFSSRRGPDLLRQCSRGAPDAGTAWFVPARAHVAALDRAVASAGARRPGMPPDVATAADVARLYAVEVVGIVRGGRRYVYGNYYPIASRSETGRDPSIPTIVCDGGPRFFGAEIDAATGALTHIDFNGPR